VINEEEYALVDAAETAMDDVIQVNFYDPDIYKKRK
jgi:hypothetical protein